MPNFLGIHQHSIPILQILWKNCQAMVIRTICELCRNENRVMNLSRVLDITQEIRDSLIPIVNCNDYTFTVHLGILAGKRDFLHYDMWLKNRIKDIGTPFILPLLKYINENIVMAVRKAEEVDEAFKLAVLERSHLTPEKLSLTLEHLRDLSNRENAKIDENTQEKITETISDIIEIFPS